MDGKITTKYFMDMDGVIARYERDAYDKSKGPLPGIALYEHERSHYFRNCIPDHVAIKLLRDLLKLQFTETWILTTVNPRIPWAADDKRIWLREHVPEFDTGSRLIIAESDKAETVMVQERMSALDRSMILIDDFNGNLNDWADAGGLAIKYLNGVNSPGTFRGPEFDAVGLFMGGCALGT